MDVNSWFRRTVSKLKKTSFTTSTAAAAAAGNTNKSKLQEEEEEKLYGITHQLIEFIKSFSLDTFKNFPLPEESECDGGNSGSVRTDLSDWQETHAMLVLSRVKELAQLRFRLCPRCLKERQFWRIYFALVKDYVAEYELHAIRLAKVKQIRTGSGTVSDSSACEVEMSEAKFIMSATSLEQKSSNS
ncbi:hypothetical protein ACS0TY_025638 [Phlomoides rotata]